MARRAPFGAESSELNRLDRVFDPDPIADDVNAEKLRSAVATWSQRDLDEGDILELRDVLMSVLKDWPRPLHPRPSQVPNTRARIADSLVLRVVLTRLERVLRDLRYELTTLEQHELEAAGRVRDALLGYVPWTPSPLGPLSHVVMGFAFRRHGGGPGELYAQVLRGDPHGLISGLGDVTALALAGRQRVVLGFSATASFAGSPKSHVLCPVWLLQPDGIDGLTVHGVTVPDADRGGKAVRVSGEASLPKRLERLERLSFLMWDNFLQDHMNSLASGHSTRERARVLLVTGSYRESRSVAEALSRAMGGSEDANRRIRYLVRGSELRRDRPDIRAIPSREIESFGASEADVLIAPLGVVARGHNIVVPGSSGRSALASVFVLVRPVPPTDDVARALAHVSYEANRTNHPGLTVTAAMDAERRHAEQCLRQFRRGAGPFGNMPAELRNAVLCDVLVDLAQLAGRCRRGGTDVRLFLVDGAFHDDHVGWRRLIYEAFERWKSAGAGGDEAIASRILKRHGIVCRMGGLKRGCQGTEDNIVSVDRSVFRGSVCVQAEAALQGGVAPTLGPEAARRSSVVSPAGRQPANSADGSFRRLRHIGRVEVGSGRLGDCEPQAYWYRDSATGARGVGIRRMAPRCEGRTG